MRVSIEKKEGAIIVDVCDLGVNEDFSEILRPHMMDLIETNKVTENVVLCLDNINHLTSSDIGFLIALSYAAEGRNRMFMVCGLQEEIKNVFNTMQLNEILYVIENKDQCQCKRTGKEHE